MEGKLKKKDEKELRPHYIIQKWKSVTMCEVKLRWDYMSRQNERKWWCRTQIKMTLHDIKYSKKQWKCMNWNEDGVRWDKNENMTLCMKFKLLKRLLHEIKFIMAI